MFKVGDMVEDQSSWKDKGVIISISPTEIEVKWLTINARDGEGFTTWINIENFDLGYRLL